jgi:hypothetical protein
VQVANRGLLLFLYASGHASVLHNGNQVMRLLATQHSAAQSHFSYLLTYLLYAGAVGEGLP